MRRAVRVVLVAAMVATPAVLGTVGSPATSSAAKSPITVGYISDLTGVASAEFVNAAGGAQAVIDDVDAHGGVNGHQLKLVVKDDASTIKGNLTAAEELVQSDHATVIVDYSSFAFAGASYLQKAGIPVVGSAFDGPEWATKPNTNMFSWTPPEESPVNGRLYTTTVIGKFLKDLGVTSFGGVGYGISPSSTDSILAAEKSAETQGITTCYTNNTVNFGATTFTADVLQIKAAKCASLAGSLDEESDLGLSAGLKNAGLTGVKQLYFTGYTSITPATASARAAFDGDYASAGINFSPPNSAGKAFLALLKKYDRTFTGGIPQFGVLGSAISAQLAVFGLEHAGANPTPAAFIRHLRSVKSWNDTGLLPAPVTFTGFGTTAMFPKESCSYFEKLTGSTWKLYRGGPICGTLITMPAPSS